MHTEPNDFSGKWINGLKSIIIIKKCLKSFNFLNVLNFIIYMSVSGAEDKFNCLLILSLLI